MCRKEVRTLSQALTLRYDKVLFILDPTEQAKRLAGKKVVVCDYPDGRLEIMHESVALPYRTFDKLRSVHRSGVVENKRLDDVLSIVAEMQAGRELQRSQSGPAPHRADGPYVRHSRRQPEQRLSEARAASPAGGRIS